MKILVVGGSRFSGKIIVKDLVEKGHDVTVLNRGKSEQSIPEFFINEKHIYPKKAQIIHADRRNRDEIRNQLLGKDFEAIIDTSAYTVEDVEIIIDSTPKQIDHYILTSTASVYDEEKNFFMPISEEAHIGSESEECPVQYSRDKRRIESFLKKRFDEIGYPITLIRPTYIYGPYNPIYREFYFYDRIMSNKPIYMPGHGDYLVDFVFAKDVAWLLTAPLENKKAIGQAYNATTGEACTLNVFVKLLGEIIGNEVEIIHYDQTILEDVNLKPENNYQMFPYGWYEHLILSKEKAVLDLGYKPTPLMNGEELTFEWYKKSKNPNWHGDYNLDQKIAKIIKK
ncbi:MAG: NAD-dependent epimerase/dehydratase family protein [Candidatus Heimdallarchaeota archaeon]|nr:NAD-dependent epimerase/dehydratase family protein [Candidatus Heimdallarchaeota archaeon]